MKMTTLLAVLGALVLWVPVASAAGTGWYVGGGVGESRFQGDEVDLEPTLANETYILNNLDKSGKAWKLFAGKQFSRNWAVEAAYTYLGKYSYDATITSAGNADEYGEAKPDCWSLSGVGILPLGDSFSLFGKIGVCRWDDHAYAEEAGVPYEANTTGNSATYGIGAQYDFANGLGIRGEWERFDKVVHDREGSDLISASLQYGF